MLSSRHLWCELQSCTFYCTNEWVELMVTEFRWNIWRVYWQILSSLWSNDSYTLSKVILVLIWRTKVTIIQLFTNTCALVSHLIIVSVYLWERQVELFLFWLHHPPIWFTFWQDVAFFWSEHIFYFFFVIRWDRFKAHVKIIVKMKQNEEKRILCVIIRIVLFNSAYMDTMKGMSKLQALQVN